ncbi:MAG TPA: DUF4382 domain-containing protein [Gemmatimonadales bacterium]
MLRKTFWLAGALALTLAACDDDDDDLVTPPGTTSVTILLTDAPGDILDAVVTIDQAFVQGTGVSRVDLLDAPVTVNLTDLANTTSELLSGAEVTNGTYSDLRLVISGAFVEVENEDGSSTIFASSPDYSGLPEGATVGGELTLPADAASGSLVDFAEDLALDGGSVSLLADFNVSQSFTDGGTGAWTLQPVLRGAAAGDAATVTVTLALGADVTLPEGVTLAGFTADLGGERLAFAEVGGTFTAAFSFVLPGTYALSLIGPAGLTLTTDPALPVDVVVGAAGAVTQTVTITAATPAP